MNTEYKLSGKPGNIFIIGLILGPLLTVLLSIIYAYIDVYNPLIYFTIIVYLGFLAGIVAIQKLVVRLSKCRSTISAIIYGAIVGFFGIYAAWCMFLFVMFRKEGVPVDFMELFSTPTRMFDIASGLSEDGYYNIFGITMKGAMLWIIWTIEALGIIAAGIFGGYMVMHEEVFCEDCNQWTEDIKLDLRLAFKEKEQVKASIDSDLHHLLKLPLAHVNQYPHLKVNIHQCSKCNYTTTLDVDLISMEISNKGEAKEKSDDFSPVYELSHPQYKSFLDKKSEKTTVSEVETTIE